MKEKPYGWALTFAVISLVGMSADARESEKQPLTVRDSLELTMPTLSENLELVPLVGSGLESQAVAILHRDNLDSGLKHYSLVAFQSKDVLEFVNSPQRAQLPSYEVLLEFGSVEGGAIQGMRWLPQTQQLSFLGYMKETGDTGQVYLFDPRTRKLQQLTHHDGSINSYSLSLESQRLVYTAQAAPLQSAHKLERYVVGATQDTRNGFSFFTQKPGERPELTYFAMDLRTGKVVRLISNEPQTLASPTPVFISPSGRWAIRLATPRALPQSWQEYPIVNVLYPTSDWKSLGWSAYYEATGGVPFGIQQFQLMDLESGVMRPMFDAPATVSDSDPTVPVIAWSPDEQAAFVSQTFLSLGDLKGPQRLHAATVPAIAEFNIASGQATRIVDDVKPQASGYMRGFGPALLEARADGSLLVKRMQFEAVNGAYRKKTLIEHYRKQGRRWINQGTKWNEGEPQPYARVAVEPTRLTLFRTDNLQTPPALEARDMNSGKHRIITDLNPQLRGMALGEVKPIQWKDKFGSVYDGGVLLPSDYQPGRRYPLVIQTYGFDTLTPFMLGLNLTPMPGRVFVSKGIAVLQVSCEPYPPDSIAAHYDRNRPLAVIACLEAAIDAVHAKGWVDRQRVGLIGFSATGNDVHQAVTFSQYPFAAAVIADSWQSTLWDYLANAYGTPESYLGQFDGVEPIGGVYGAIGSQFIGAGVKRWLERSPMFYLDQIRTPLLYEAHGSPCSCWDTYAILKRARRPIELAYYSDEAHDLVRPKARFASRQSIVDWFAFWLKGEERLQPLQGIEEDSKSLASQYVRWHALYAQQKAHLEDLRKAGADPATLPALP